MSDPEFLQKGEIWYHANYEIRIVLTDMFDPEHDPVVICWSKRYNGPSHFLAERKIWTKSGWILL